jgi:hypothetical protein
MVHMKALSALFKCSDPKIWIYMYLRTLRPAPLLHPRAQPRAWRPRSRFRGTTTSARRQPFLTSLRRVLIHSLPLKYGIYPRSLTLVSSSVIVSE